MRGPRVLVLAEAANPEWPSVPLVGWSHYRALARKVDAHLVTHVRNLDAIERAGLVEGRDFTAIDSERVAGPMWRTSEAIRKGLGLGATFTQGFNIGAYYYYEHLVMKQLGAQLRAHEFDLVHRLTPLSPVPPSLLAKECRQVGVPFVWGPINGGVPWPPGFGKVQRREGELLSAVRGLHKLLPGYRSTRENAAATLVASQITPSAPELRRTPYLSTFCFRKEGVCSGYEHACVVVDVLRIDLQSHDQGGGLQHGGVADGEVGPQTVRKRQILTDGRGSHRVLHGSRRVFRGEAGASIIGRRETRRAHPGPVRASRGFGRKGGELGVWHWAYPAIGVGFVEDASKSSG